MISNDVSREFPEVSPNGIIFSLINRHKISYFNILIKKLCVSLFYFCLISFLELASFLKAALVQYGRFKKYIPHQLLHFSVRLFAAVLSGIINVKLNIYKLETNTNTRIHSLHFISLTLKHICT